LAIIDEILSKRPGLSADQVRALIEEKKKELPNFLSDEGAARLVAEELLIKTSGIQLGRLQIKDLVNGLNDVAISGRILAAWPYQTFQRRDGSLGKVLRLIIVDKSSKARCVLWDRHVETVSKDNLQGRIIRIGHAYTRQGLAGDVEIHAGDRSIVEIDPHEIPTADFPEFREMFIPINEIPKESNHVNVVGVVQAEPRRHSFTKNDRAGTVFNTILGDQSGRITLVAWNERADELRDIKKGDILQIINARIRLNQNAKAELHVESGSQVSLLHQPPDNFKMPPKELTTKIASLTTQSSFTDLIVAVISKGEIREIKRPTGETLRVSSILVGDDTGMITLTLWDDKVDSVRALREGDSLRLHGANVRDRFGEIQLNIGAAGQLEKVDIPQKLTQPTRIDSLANVKGLVTVEGRVIDQPVVRQVSTEKGENINVTSLTLKEEAGSIRITLWRDHANLATRLMPNCRVRVTGARIRTGLNGQMELSSIPLTKLSILPNNVEKPAWEDIRKIISLEAGLATWIKGQVVKIQNHEIEIDDGTGVINVLYDNVSFDDKAVFEDVGSELEIYGITEKTDENTLVFKATKVFRSTK